MLPARQAQNAPAIREPFGEVERLANDLLSFARNWQLPAFEGFQTALADLEERDDEFVVDVDLPGVDKSDVDVQLEGRRLIVTAERKERERTGILRRRTRTVGTMRHEVLLPADVDEDGIKATMADGVLTVTLPKTASARRHRIAVS